MFSRFGRMIWAQNRDIRVVNYEKHIVYEIYNNQGYLYISQSKSEPVVEWLTKSHTSPSASCSLKEWKKVNEKTDLEGS
jgi:hypothetical protein